MAINSWLAGGIVAAAAAVRPADDDVHNGKNGIGLNTHTSVGMV